MDESRTLIETESQFKASPPKGESVRHSDPGWAGPLLRLPKVDEE